MTHPRERQLPWMFTWKMCNFTANSKRVCQLNFEQTANKTNERSPSPTLGPQPQFCHCVPQPFPRAPSCSPNGGLLCCSAGFIDLIFVFQGWGTLGNSLDFFFGGVLLQMCSCALPSFGEEGWGKTFVLFLVCFQEGLLATVQCWRRMAFL